jgi:hypothetical protein
MDHQARSAGCTRAWKGSLLGLRGPMERANLATWRRPGLAAFFALAYGLTWLFSALSTPGVTPVELLASARSLGAIHRGFPGRGGRVTARGLRQLRMREELPTAVGPRFWVGVVDRPRGQVAKW